MGEVSRLLSLEWHALPSDQRESYPPEGNNGRKRKSAEILDDTENWYRQRLRLWGNLKNIVSTLTPLLMRQCTQLDEYYGVSTLVFYVEKATSIHQIYYPGRDEDRNPMFQYYQMLHSGSICLRGSRRKKSRSRPFGLLCQSCRLRACRLISS